MTPSKTNKNFILFGCPRENVEWAGAMRCVVCLRDDPLDNDIAKPPRRWVPLPPFDFDILDFRQEAQQALDARHVYFFDTTKMKARLLAANWHRRSRRGWCWCVVGGGVVVECKRSDRRPRERVEDERKEAVRNGHEPKVDAGSVALDVSDREAVGDAALNRVQFAPVRHHALFTICRHIGRVDIEPVHVKRPGHVNRWCGCCLGCCCCSCG